MASQGMPDADRFMQTQLSRDHGGVLAETPPVVRWKVFIAAAVASQIDGDAASIGEALDDAIPDTGVKTGGVGEQNWSAGAWPLPYGQMGDSKQMHVQ